MVRALVANLGEGIKNSTSAYTYLPKIAAPYTTVVNRAEVTDFAADGLPKFGVDRSIIQSIEEVPDETGPSGERVFKPVNDVHDAVRFYGDILNRIDSNGPLVDVVSSTMEITFYGTGLQLLLFRDGTPRDLTVSVDGAATSTVSNPAISGALTARKYSVNNAIQIASGLSLGMHTVKISTASVTWYVSGYEVINASSSIFLPAATSYIGSRRLSSESTGSTAYNSGFESGTLGTRGGHVLVYQNPDGTIAKAVTPTDAAAAYLANADHTNEEVIRTYHWREFGAGRTDDFSTLAASNSDRAFTLDDGTTTLVGNDVAAQSGVLVEAASLNAVGAFIVLTFVGTGLDILRADNATTASTDTLSLSVNGVSQGSLSSTGSLTTRLEKICSGLPYGTHTVRITATTNTNFTMGIRQFLVYGPSRPTLPSGAVALSEYFLMADYAADATSPNTAFSIATGVLRKAPLRELVYSGTWSVDTLLPLFVAGGFALYTAAASGDYVECVFFGTGFNFRAQGGTGSGAISWTLSVDGSSNLSGYTTAISTGGTVSSFTAATGVIAVPASASPYTVSVSDLTLGLHKVRLTKTSGAFTSYVSGFDIITPIHAPKGIGPARLQNTSLIGSCAMGDLRAFSPSQVPLQKAWCQATGVTAGPGIGSTTADLPVADLSTTVKTNGGSLQISYSISVVNSSTGITYAAVYVNGTKVSPYKSASAQTPINATISDTVVVPVGAGTHKVDVYCQTSAGVSTAVSTYRNMTVREI